MSIKYRDSSGSLRCFLWNDIDRTNNAINVCMPNILGQEIRKGRILLKTFRNFHTQNIVVTRVLYMKIT